MEVEMGVFGQLGSGGDDEVDLGVCESGLGG